MLGELFGSKTRAAVIAVLLATPGESLHMRELVRRTGGSISGVQRELKRLGDIGLVESAVSTDGRREISLVTDHPLADALAGLVAAEAHVAYGRTVTGAATLVSPAGLLNPHVRDLAARIAETAMRFGVARIALFGSATEVDVAVVPSDLDVSVRFEPNDPRSPAERYFGLRAALEQVTGMTIDLLEPDGIENPYLLEELGRSEVVLYEAP